MGFVQDPVTGAWYKEGTVPSWLATRSDTLPGEEAAPEPVEAASEPAPEPSDETEYAMLKTFDHDGDGPLRFYVRSSLTSPNRRHNHVGGGLCTTADWRSR